MNIVPDEPYSTCRTTALNECSMGKLANDGTLPCIIAMCPPPGPVASWQMWQVPLTMCSPTRAALLTGRNSHAVGFGWLLIGSAALDRPAALPWEQLIERLVGAVGRPDDTPDD